MTGDLCRSFGWISAGYPSSGSDIRWISMMSFAHHGASGGCARIFSGRCRFAAKIRRRITLRVIRSDAQGFRQGSRAAQATHLASQSPRSGPTLNAVKYEGTYLSFLMLRPAPQKRHSRTLFMAERIYYAGISCGTALSETFTPPFYSGPQR